MVSKHFNYRFYKSFSLACYSAGLLFAAASFCPQSAHAIEVKKGLFEGVKAGESITTAPLVKSHSPAPSGDFRREQRGEVPSVEMAEKLAEAEKYIQFLIEEHNRRVDMLSLQESYVKNKQASKARVRAKALLDAADSCNARQLSSWFSGVSAYVPIITGSGVKTETLSGGSIWSQGIKPYILGAKTVAINEAKPAAGIWWGNPYDPISLNCDRKDNSDKYKICKLASAQGLSGDLSKYNNLRGLKELIEDGYTARGLMAEYTDRNDNFKGIYGDKAPSGSGEGDALKYRKERWKVGYQLLMDIYHNEKFGGIDDSKREDRMWADQKMRYFPEVAENFFLLYEDHYGKCPSIPRPSFDSDYHDYIEHLPGTTTSGQGGWYADIEAYNAARNAAHIAAQQWSCCDLGSVNIKCPEKSDGGGGSGGGSGGSSGGSSSGGGHGVGYH